MGMELVLRVYHGRFFQLESLVAPSSRVGPMEYDSVLGWVPRPGRYTSNSNWTSSVDSHGLRDNGRNLVAAGQPILAVGDSFTFGNEVEDSETWPAYLEGLLDKRVLNAGVGAYGIDQAVLRAEALLAEYDPELVILSFISDDISRAENSFYFYGRGWKPYFEYDGGSLSLRNSPVPTLPPAFHRYQSLRRILSYSSLADFVLDRALRSWWRDIPQTVRVHEDGESVSVALLVRLNDLTRERGSQLIAIALATNGEIGGNERLPNVIEGAKENGIQVIDLAMETLNLPSEQLRRAFRPNGHYSPEMNAWIADQIANILE